MAQRSQIVDITKSYLPGDPNAVVQNLVNTDREDGEEKTLPLIPYEGYNFLPTHYGYKSFFGTNSALGLDAITSRVQAVLNFQLPTYKSRFIALAEDGIWVGLAEGTDTRWIQLVVHTFNANIYEEWTWCIIENILYMYKQGGANVYKTGSGILTVPIDGITPAYDLTNDLTITGFAPSFLNMAGQMGIFKAGLRLGFWDSANSVSWSSNVDLADFTPSLENLAGNRIFGYVVGRIVTIRSHGEGFIIYSTKSIVGVTFSPNSNLIWDGKKVFDNSGISHSHAVITGKSDADHFVYGINNIYAIGKFNALLGKYEGEVILPEIYDFLKESRDPVSLSILQDRYLCFSLISSDYIYGKQSFYENYVNPYEFVVDWYTPSDGYPTASTALLPTQLWEIVREEMSGVSRTKRKDGDWVPLYTTTVDIMDDRYYSFWRVWMLEQGTRLSYDDYSTYLDGTISDLTISDIEDYLDAQRPTNPPDAFRYGKLRTSTAIRAFEGTAGGVVRENNEHLIYGQESEWDAYIRHASANKTKLETISYAPSPTTVQRSGEFTPYDPTYVDTVIGSYITGEGNNEWLTTEGPSDKAAKEVILRRTFNKAFQISRRETTTKYADNIVAPSATPGVRGDYATGSYGRTGDDPSILVLPAGTLKTATYSMLSTVGAVVTTTETITVSGQFVYYTDAANYQSIQYLEGAYPGEPGTNYLFSYTITRTAGVYDYANAKIWNLADKIAAIDAVGQLAYDRAVDGGYDENTVITDTYLAEETTGSYGYSQFRALVTRWDRIKFGLYGNYEILESVPAEAMTAKIWEGTYPTDKGANRNQIWTYSQYKAIRLPDLVEGTIGPYGITGPDASGTATVEDSDFPSTGVQSRHDSYTLPGATFLLQTGSIEAVYPTFTGALVYDLSLKKWGKYKGDHKLLVEVTPVNSAAFGTISFSDLGANAGILDAAGNIYLFDTVPLDSWIRYGKLGYYRLGMTNLLEVKASMRYPSDFTISTASSMDGKILDMSTATYHPYYDEVIAEALPDVSARWHVVTISGNYDLTGLEIRATIAGRR